MTYEYEFKTISLGKEAVGKTSLIRRFAVGQFSETYIPTLGVDFFVKNVRINKTNVKLLLYDTAGQESFGPLRPLYYRKAHGAFIVFDISRRSSFEKLDYWYNEVYINCGAIPYIIIGNKLDLEADRTVSIEEATNYAVSNGLRYIETSAKTGENVNELFEILTENMLESQPRV